MRTAATHAANMTKGIALDAFSLKLLLNCLELTVFSEASGVGFVEDGMGELDGTEVLSIDVLAGGSIDLTIIGDAEGLTGVRDAECPAVVRDSECSIVVVAVSVSAVVGAFLAVDKVLASCDVERCSTGVCWASLTA